MWTVILLIFSNIFMTFAWYGHPRFRHEALWKVILVSWCIAFFEYRFQVPANRIGADRFSPVQLKVIQEIITLVVFGVFTTYYFGSHLRWNHATLLCAWSAQPSLSSTPGSGQRRCDQCPSASRNFSASSAAMHPEPAAVIACRYRLSCTSPQAKTPRTTTPFSVVSTLPVVLI